MKDYAAAIPPISSDRAQAAGAMTSQRLKAAVASGDLDWSGEKPSLRLPKAVNRSGELLSDIVAKNRERSSSSTAARWSSLYVQELGTQDTIEYVAEAQAVGASTLAKVEVTAAFCKKLRMGPAGGGIDSNAATEALSAFSADWPAFVKRPVVQSVIDAAERLVLKHGLRAFDAVQLSSALDLQEFVGEAVTMMVFDDELRRAAARESLPLWPDDVTAYRTFSRGTPAPS